MNHKALVELAELLKDRKQSLSLAESCTGGLLSSMITTPPGVSGFYLGAAVTYCNQSKQRILNVQEESLKAFGAVSEEVAREMAIGAREVFASDWAISITGVAGPSGGSPEKPVGTVCFGICGPKIVRSERMRFDGIRTDIQLQSVEYAVSMLLREMKELAPKPAPAPKSELK
ncbi:MAG: CinA family protein [Methylococcales bacterium]|nr:CinA family protein [Methylococcales bacterium]